MNDRNIIQHIGDYRVHDAIIKKIIHQKQTIEVLLNSVDKELIKFAFHDVQRIKEKQAEGMILYSAVEIRAEESFRHFVFVNWDESDNACLEIVAKRYDFQKME